MAVRVPANLYQYGGPPVSVWANGFSRLKPANSTWDAPIDANRYNQGELARSSQKYRYPSLKAPSDNSEMATSRYPMGASLSWDKAIKSGEYNKKELHNIKVGGGSKYPLLTYPSFQKRFDQFDLVKQDTTSAKLREKDEALQNVPSQLQPAKKFSMIDILTSLNQMMPRDPKIKEMLETTIRLELTKQSRQLTTDEEALERSIKAEIEKITEKPIPPQRPVDPSRMPRPGEQPPTPADIVTSEDRKRMKEMGVMLTPGDDSDAAVYKLEKMILESKPQDIRKTLDLWDRDFSDFSRLAGNPVSDVDKFDIKTTALQNVFTDHFERLKRKVIGRAPEDVLNFIDAALVKIDNSDLDELIESMKRDVFAKNEERVKQRVNEYDAEMKELRKNKIKKIEDKIKDLENELKEVIKKRDSKNTKRKKRRILNEQVSLIKKDIRKNRNEIKTIKGQPQAKQLANKSKSFPSMSGPSVSFPQPPQILNEEEEEKEFEDPQILNEEEEKEVEQSIRKKTKDPRKDFRDMLELQKNISHHSSPGYIKMSDLRDKALELGIQVPWKHKRSRAKLINYLLEQRII